MRETRDLEFKQSVSNTFLKTVTAYANYGTGKILFGVRDDGKILGIKDLKDACLQIENMINDSIKPVPDFSIAADNEKKTIVLSVSEGLDKPYFYKSKAYKRSDTVTVEIDRLELTRLILEGQNRSYDGLISPKRDLSFTFLEKKLKAVLGIDKLTKDLLITLELYRKDEGYTIAGELLSDTNSSASIDIVRFGENINIFLHRVVFDGMSLLEQYDKAVEKYREYYQYETIEGSVRKKYETVPEKAYREALANALVHRNWDTDTQIKVAMHPNKIVITSPGSLPKGLSEEEYIMGQISVLRNPIIGNVFFRLRLIERFGTWIQRILESYKDSKSKPQFKAFENSVKIVLPLLESEAGKMSEEERQVYNVLSKTPLAISEIVKLCGFGKTKTLGILKALGEASYIRKVGKGRATKYTVSA